MAITIEKSVYLRSVIEEAVQYLSKEKALTAIELFPIWKPKAEYKEGIKVNYNGTLYKVIKTHTSNNSETPDKAGKYYELF